MIDQLSGQTPHFTLKVSKDTHKSRTKSRIFGPAAVGNNIISDSQALFISESYSSAAKRGKGYNLDWLRRLFEVREDNVEHLGAWFIGHSTGASFDFSCAWNYLYRYPIFPKYF